MAKKITLDFSKTEERSGWNSKQIPEGLHKMKVESAQVTEASDGTDMIVYALVPADPRYRSRRFPYYCKLQQNQLWKLRDLLVAAGIPVPKAKKAIDPDAPVGKFIAAEVGDATGQYEGRSEVNNTYGLDILDEEAPAESEEDDEEESDDEVEEEFEEDDSDDAEDDEEPEEDELDTLTLPELRKRAKGLGIAIAGLKQADLIEAIREEEAGDEEDEDELDEGDLEDDDLGDEELYEDDEEDEPEPAPAPRKRPAAKPAAKAPAKAAAPAKRTVKRR